MAPPRPKAGKKAAKDIKVSQTKTIPKEHNSSNPVPLDLQQLLLNIFKDSFSICLQSDIQPLLQEVKGHLFNRDFLTAFGRNDYLEAYAARWSPSRALGYLQVLLDLKNYIHPLFTPPSDDGREKKIVCLGGGAGAEVVAFGGLLHYLRKRAPGPGSTTKIDVAAIDIANWSKVIEELHFKIVTEPKLSKFASAAAQAVNAPLISPEDFSVPFHQQDILNTDLPTLTSLLQDATLITIMFTLNELYATSLPLTQRFLLHVTECLREGALLLVVDSPGSYSTVSLNGAEKKYPMQWLLDHTLLREGSKGERASWTKLEEDESRWFRLNESLQYPIELENMRFQLHLYRRVS